MATNFDKMAQRLASIAAAKPLLVVAPPPKAPPRRNEKRQAVYRFGRLTVAGGVRLDCIIADISPNGAKVELDGASSLPELLTLKVVMTGETRRARVAWKRDHSAGLSFVMEPNSQFGNAPVRR